MLGVFSTRHSPGIQCHEPKGFLRLVGPPPVMVEIALRLDQLPAGVHQLADVRLLGHLQSLHPAKELLRALGGLLGVGPVISVTAACPGHP